MSGYQYTSHGQAQAMVGKKAKLLRDFRHYTGHVAKAGSIVVIDSFDEHPNSRGFGFTVDGVKRAECGFSDFDFNV